MVDVGAAPPDRYVVLEHLSEGGMGAIYVGKKLGAAGFEMQVVLKQLLPEFTQQEEFIDLFLREAKLSATLDHANIVHTIDLVTAGGEYFIVMEYLPGGDLRTLLRKAKRRGKRFSPAAAIHIGREVLSALAYAHVKRDLEGTPLKLIHRDVSPSNILVSTAGEVKLTDFGIAKAATHNSLFYKVKGKIGYMSPEQAKSEALDHRSDLYSLAVCLYEVLTGERLFVHAGITTSADEIYSQPVPQISRKVPGLTTDLDGIMSKALALSPDARFQTAGEFQEALTRCAHRNGLLVSAPELARELLDLCGPPDQWRGDDDDDDLGYVKRAATEVYEGGADGDEDDDIAPPPFAGQLHRLPSPTAPPRPSSAPGRRPPSTRVSSARVSNDRIPRPKSDLAKLQGVVELTSIINMIDLENELRDAVGDTGDRQAVDLALSSLDSGPRPVVGARAPLPAGWQAAPGPSAAQSGAVRGPSASMPAQRGPSASMAAARGPSASMAAQPTPSSLPRSLPSAQPTPSSLPRAPLPPSGQIPRAMHGNAMQGDAGDLLPTQPQSAPRTPARREVQQFQADTLGGTVRKKSVIRSWMVILAIVLAAAVAGVVVAMSGPDVAVQHTK